MVVRLCALPALPHLLVLSISCANCQLYQVTPLLGSPTPLYQVRNLSENEVRYYRVTLRLIVVIPEGGVYPAIWCGWLDLPYFSECYSQRRNLY